MSIVSSREQPSKGLALHAAAIGVVFGDIGTSPLYTIRQCFDPVVGLKAGEASVLGILSLVFWALTLVVMVKYVIFVMRADNKGEGGVLALAAMALAAIIARKGKGATRPSATVIIAAGMLGAALFYGDGVLTPAISVLSAVEGLHVISPVLDQSATPIAAVLLVVLFLAQKRGTAGIGAWFGPIMIAWFIAIAALGIYGIVNNPVVLKALNPVYGVRLLFSGHIAPFELLGAVVLSVTGAEALYADMGHFGRNTIRRVWFAMVWPALALNYFGQGALLLADPAAIANPFFLLVPEVLRLPMVGLATLAAIIASQAVISGAFSMTSQAVELGWLPRLRVLHTSASEVGQVFVPQVNTALMLGVLATVLTFKSSANLGAAYGVAVTGTMVLTTFLFFVVVRRIKGWGFLPAIALCGAFAFLDFSFLIPNLVKVEQGGWLPIMIGILMFMVMRTWWRGRQILARRFLNGAVPLRSFIERLSDQKIPRVKGAAVFLTADLDSVPTALLHNLKHNQVLHQRVAMLRVSVEDSPRVPLDEMLKVEILDNGFARIEIRHGFMQTVDVPQQLVRCRPYGLEFPPMETSYFVSRQTLVPAKPSAMPRWQSRLFILLTDYALGPTEFFGLPPNRVVELGTKAAV